MDMIVKLMGLMDILSGIGIILFNFELISLKFAFAIIIYLLIKGFAFRGDLASIGDFGIAIYMILMMFYPITFLSFIVAIYLFQKGIVSFF